MKSNNDWDELTNKPESELTDEEKLYMSEYDQIDQNEGHEDKAGDEGKELHF